MHALTRRGARQRGAPQGATNAALGRENQVECMRSIILRALALPMFVEPGRTRPCEADTTDLHTVPEIERLAVGHDDLARNDAQLTLFAAVALDDIAGADRKSARELAHSHGSLSCGVRTTGTTL